MKETVFHSLTQLLANAVQELIDRKAPGTPLPDSLSWGAPKNPEYGDLATNAALMLAKPLRSNPLKLAEELAEPIRQSPWVERLSVAAPGFVNIALSRDALGRMLAEPHEQGPKFGHGTAGSGQSVLLEFVSANPTGPLHVGHARHAAVGDTLARLLQAAGWKVHCEFYINDAGNQIETLGRSFRTRILQLLGEDDQLPADGYPGDYLLYYAWKFLRTVDPRIAEGVDDKNLIGDTDPHRFSTSQQGDARRLETDDAAEQDAASRREAAQNDWIQRASHRLLDARGTEAVQHARNHIASLGLSLFSDYAKGRLLEMIKRTLTDLRVHFDAFFSESSLYLKGAVESTLQELKASGGTYDHEGAIWLRSAEKGDDKDRVLVKSDGSYTYLLPDLAYHRDKYHRRGGALGEHGPDLLINLFGSDHDGYPPRLKVGLDYLACPPDKLHILLMRLVFLVREGERLDMGKRSGNFVSARDLLDDVGCDVLRFFLLQRSANSEINFDLDLAREHSDRNPVFKIQYAHARICSLFRKAQERGFAWNGFRKSDIEHLVAAEEKDLIREIARLPETVERAARALETHPISVYLLGLAELFNRYWSQAKVDPEYRMIDPDTPARTQARLSLAAAIRIAIANGLHLLGVEAPERMEREEEAEEET